MAKDYKKKKEEVGTRLIGIDLGTTYSCVGVYKNWRVEIIANDQGNRSTPSYVAFTADGDAAKNQLTTNPENAISDAKGMSLGEDVQQKFIESWNKSAKECWRLISYIVHAMA